MTRIRTITALLLSFCIVLAGVPVQAKPQCPMGKMQMAVEMAKMEDCAGMAKTAKQDTNKCCDDAACTFQCSTSASVSAGFMPQPILSPPVPLTQTYQATNDIPAFFWLSTQERPPKILS